MIHGGETAEAPRARRRGANLERILDAAMELVAAGGFEALSMQRLAAAVDYTPGALYRYFDSKDALLGQLVRRTLDGLRGFLGRALALLPAGAGPLDRALVLVQGYAAYARLEPHRFSFLAMTLAAPSVLLTETRDADPVAHEMVVALAPLGEALGAAAARGLIDEGDVAARTVTLFALVQGTLLLRKQARYAPSVIDVERLGVEGARALLVGWGAKARTVDAALGRVAALALGTRLQGGVK